MQRKGVIIILVFSIIILSIIFNNYDPEKSVWFPKCPFYIITGFQCPACGSQRAVYHLLHLHFRDAISYNPFLVISLPYVILLILVTWIVPQDRYTKIRAIVYNPTIVRIYIILIVVWWVVRNVNIL